MTRPAVAGLEIGNQDLLCARVEGAAATGTIALRTAIAATTET
jgi:hypothetical protein